jgi:hypothetical protein
MAMRYEASYKQVKLTAKQTEKSWQPDVVPPSRESRLLDYPAYATLDEAKEKACREATRMADRVGKSCAEVWIEWREVSD